MPADPARLERSSVLPHAKAAVRKGMNLIDYDYEDDDEDDSAVHQGSTKIQ
jgi:hypothetical protein